MASASSGFSDALFEPVHPEYGEVTQINYPISTSSGSNIPINIRIEPEVAQNGQVKNVRCSVPVKVCLKGQNPRQNPHLGRDPDLYCCGERYPDWPLLITSGSGRFCGVHLHVWNPNPKGRVRRGLPKKMRDYGKRITHIMRQAGRHWWWGEGDEKFFVDDEKFPSTFGTGSEDYFGYAWAANNPVEFESALQNQPLNKNSSLGHVSNNRFQIADNVPFQKSFEACIEKYHPNEWPLLYSATAYWYQRMGQQDPYGPAPAKERVDYYVKPEPEQAVRDMKNSGRTSAITNPLEFCG